MTLSQLKNEISNEVDFENVVDGFSFFKARVQTFPSASGSKMTCHGSPLGKIKGKFED